jgi:hypothetical protein
MLHVDFTPEDAENYNTVSKDVTINVLKATPAIIWNNPPAIIYGTALSEIQLNASASVPGSFVYNPVYGAILGAGDQTLHTTFTPADSTNYTTAGGNVLLIVNKATPSIAWSKPADIVYGTPLSETQLNASASVPGTFVYTPMAETVLSAGTQALHVDFTPADAANFTTASKDVTINVLTPVQKIQQVTTNVQEIVTSGTLNKGQGNALIVKLNAATKNLNAGNTNAAINELNAFNNQIKAYIKSGKLFSREGQALIDEINSVTNVLSK